MSVLEFGSGSAWNYSDPTKDSYKPQITGTVVEISEVQSINYMTKQAECWPDGNPKLNVQFMIQEEDGTEYPFVFSPKSLGATAVKQALLAWKPDSTKFADLGGQMVTVATQGDSKQYGNNNPRPWWFTIHGPGNAPFRGVKPFERPQAPVQQVPIQQPTNVPPTPLNRPIQQQPAPVFQQPQPVYQQPMQQQPVYQQPMQQQPVYQQPQPVYQQPMQQQQPVYQQPAPQVAGAYDEEIPF